MTPFLERCHPCAAFEKGVVFENESESFGEGVILYWFIQKNCYPNTKVSKALY